MINRKRIKEVEGKIRDSKESIENVRLDLVLLLEGSAFEDIFISGFEVERSQLEIINKYEILIDGLKKERSAFCMLMILIPSFIVCVIILGFSSL